VIEIETIETSSLGDRSYLAHDGQLAVVIDPQRDIDRILDLAASRGVQVSTVLEATSTTTTSPAGWSSAGARGRRTCWPPAAASPSTTRR
jgi:hypothetical protein